MHVHLDQMFNQMTEYRARTTAIESHRGLVGPPSSLALEEPPAFMSLAKQYGLTDEDFDASEPDDHGVQTIEQEYQAYITAPICAKGTPIIKWWEVSQKTDTRMSVDTDYAPQYNQSAFPTLFAIAMDYLPIQASAVPCERVFSSSAETDTKKRNRISPLLMEVLQMLKFHLKKERLNFTEGWLTSEKEMTETEPEEGLLTKLLDPSFQDTMDQVIQSINSYED